VVFVLKNDIGIEQTFKTNYMKKKLIIGTALALFIGSGLFFGEAAFNQKAVNKDINVEVYKDASYVSPAYADTYASLEVTVVRVHGNKRDTAWQHTFAPKQLSEYPSADKPLLQKISIPNVNDRKEKLEIYYRLTYNTKGSVLDFLNTTMVGKGQQTGKLNIKI
jgi:hypothetical protein